ncbi:MAG: hypothetical protein H0T46_34600 [Deltaproteobacteria bacterium]|nr:hypothetical protein [Deltaproteobacteria bacterium]
MQCSSTSKPSPPVVPTKSIDAAVAPVDAGPEEDADDDFGYKGYFFEWQQLRDERDEFLKTPVGAKRCDTRASDFKPTTGCKGPHEVAGLAIFIRGSAPVHVVVDVGSRDGVSKDWTAALLDEGGRPVTAWMPVIELEPRSVVIGFPIRYGEAFKWKRVGLRIDQNLRDAIRQRNTGHNN